MAAFEDAIGVATEGATEDAIEDAIEEANEDAIAHAKRTLLRRD